MELANRLKVEIVLWDLRPADVARRAGMPESQLSHILSGKKQPKPATLRRIVEAIHSDIIGGEQDGTAKAGKSPGEK